MGVRGTKAKCYKPDLVVRLQKIALNSYQNR